MNPLSFPKPVITSASPFDWNVCAWSLRSRRNKFGHIELKSHLGTTTHKL